MTTPKSFNKFDLLLQLLLAVVAGSCRNTCSEEQVINKNVNPTA